ncbi:hypothetical protein SAMN06265348_103480 [Pedobacter westerhofensis]|uniref:Lipoprotein n=1 Tax=Pedobacter westerhofensis TaxID=425512 RepID=A0A521CDJ2_9SPHI|nr:hypothetical protein [Pedobacter westerhofensis]SMO57497.1 hypothetical protein SAMN06265348_103480 [Pedobacter westerhofensis]
MKIFLLYFLIIIGLCSCERRGKKITSGGITYMNYNTREKDTAYLDIKGHKYKHLGAVPDSLRTTEQKKLINAINDVLLNGVVVEDNKEVLKFSKEECLARGLNAHYYDELQNNIRTNNSYFEANGNKNVAQMKASLDSVLRGTKKE